MTMVAQVVLKGLSGLPQDRFVNTFHFAGAANKTVLAEALEVNVPELYNDDPPGFDAICTDLSTNLSRATDASEIRVYDLTEPIPRIPAIRKWTLGASGFAAEDNLPGEVALCVSYYSDDNIPRQRGRVYVGPWSQAVGANDGSEIFRPVAARVSALVESFARFRDLNHAGASWVVHSAAYPGGFLKNGDVNPPRAAADHEITHIWANDEFDTIRKRGAEAAARITNP